MLLLVAALHEKSCHAAASSVATAGASRSPELCPPSFSPCRLKVNCSTPRANHHCNLLLLFAAWDLSLLHRVQSLLLLGVQSLHQ